MGLRIKSFRASGRNTPQLFGAVRFQDLRLTSDEDKSPLHNRIYTGGSGEFEHPAPEGFCVWGLGQSC